MANAPVVLVLDEEDALRRATALILANRGARVSEAATLDEAVGLAARRPYDVAILDLGHRSPGGAEALRRFDARGCRPSRVVVCTEEDPGHELGAALVLTKPYSFEELLRVVFGKPEPEPAPQRRPPRRPARSGFPSHGRARGPAGRGYARAAIRSSSFDRSRTTTRR